MSFTTALAIYFLVWWLVLFTVLPWGVNPQGADGVPGTDPGAPRVHNLKMKLVWTTVVSAVLFAAGMTVFLYRIVTLDDLARWMGWRL
jgi:predicted secreted protein